MRGPRFVTTAIAPWKGLSSAKTCLKRISNSGPGCAARRKYTMPSGAACPAPNINSPELRSNMINTRDSANLFAGVIPAGRFRDDSCPLWIDTSAADTYAMRRLKTPRAPMADPSSQNAAGSGTGAILQLPGALMIDPVSDWPRLKQVPLSVQPLMNPRS